ncbi:MAG: sulfatase-like hydrolase/transferase, partial [Planctomycetota bacterium]
DAEPAEYHLGILDAGMRMVFDKGDRVLREWDRERPLFLFLQVLDVHGPYMTRAPWAGRFASEDPGPSAPVVGNFDNQLGTVQLYQVQPFYEGRDIPEQVAIHPLRDAYDEKILEMDAVLGDYFDRWKRRGYLDDGLLLLSADHGESVLQHDILFRHKATYEEVTHIPLVVRLPGGERGGRRVSERVSLVDLYPTFGELVGLGPTDLRHHGQSLAATLRAEPLPSRPAIVESSYFNQRAVVVDDWKLVLSEPWKSPNLAGSLSVPRNWHRWAAAYPELAAELAGSEDLTEPPYISEDRDRAFRQRHPKARQDLIRLLRQYGPQVELFDLADDPFEEQNVAQEHPERVQQLLNLLYHGDRAIEGARDEVRVDDVDLELDAASRAELIALGYLDEDDSPEPADPTPGPAPTDQ